MKRIEWWVYTIGFGLIPLVLRIAVTFVVKPDNFMFIMNNSDLIGFNIVLCIGNLKELGEQREFSDAFKMGMKGLILFLMIPMSFFLGAIFLNEFHSNKLFDPSNLNSITYILSATCLFLSLNIYYNVKFVNS